jgi:hypothetical protein
MKYLVLLLLVLSTSICHAKELSFIRDYTYKASDLDSKVSARNNTLKLIKAGVLEEIVTFVSNNSSLEQSQSGNEFRSSFIQRTSASSAGFLKTRIVEESWDGFEMKIKAEVTADPEKIREELERALALKPTPQLQTVQVQPVPPSAKQQPANTQPHAAQPQPFMPVANTTADYSGYVRTAQLAEVYSLLQPLKMTILEYYIMNGEWPSSLADIRLKPEEMTDGQYLDKVRLGKDGQILAYLSNTFGKNKMLSLAPRSIMGGMQTRWDCTTNVNTKGMMGMGNMNCKEDKKLRYN